MLLDRLEKGGLFLISSMVSGSSQSTVDLLTHVWNGISVAFSSFGTITLAVPLDISKAFDRVQHAGFLHKSKPYRISGRVFDLILPFRGNRRLGVVLDGKSLQNSIHTGVPRGSILDRTLFLLYIENLDDVISVILLSMLMILLLQKWVYLLLKKNQFLKIFFFLNWIGTITLSFLLKLPLRKLKFFLL